MDTNPTPTPNNQHEPPAEHLHAAAIHTGSAPRSPKRLWWAIGIVAGVLALGGGAYFVFLGKESQQPAPTVAPHNQTRDQRQPAMDTEQAAATKTYKSAKLNIEFTYRSDWTMRETADKSAIILTSPRVPYTKKDGTAAEGVFTLKLRHGVLPEAMKPAIQNAVAVQDSEVIAYAAPTAEQRQYTNLSFAGNATNMHFFLVSGSVGFKAGEAFDSNIDLAGSVYLFAGGYGTDPNDTLAFEPVPAASFDSEAYRQAVDIVESLKIY